MSDLETTSGALKIQKFRGAAMEAISGSNSHLGVAIAAQLGRDTDAFSSSG